MSDLVQVLLLALLPAVGNFGGGLLAEFFQTSKRTLSLALHVAAGILFGVIALELVPRSFGGAPAWVAGLAFTLGGAVYLGVDALVSRLTANKNDKQSASDIVRGNNKAGGAWMIYVAVCVDLFSDGLLIGAGSSLSFSLALVLAVGQVTADIPEGFATMANFQDKGTSRTQRLLIGASFLVPVLLGALITYFLLRGAAQELQLAALAFVGGMLLVAGAEEMIGEAHQANGKSKGTAFGVVAGFVLFALVSSYFEAGDGG